MDNLRKSWNNRSIKLKDSLGSVMFSSFPNNINETVHRWQMKVLLQQMPLSKKINILDLGCGYGRLSYELSKKNKSAFFYGIDISKNYIDMYNKKMKGRGKGFVGNISNFHISNKRFDYVIVVTAFMYLNDIQISKSLKVIKNKLNKNGKLVVIENTSLGSNYVSGFGLFSKINKILGNSNHNIISSRYFKNNELKKLFMNDYVIIKEKGCFLLTLTLPLFIILSKLKLIRKSLDLYIDFPFSPSLYKAYILKAKTTS